EGGCREAGGCRVVAGSACGPPSRRLLSIRIVEPATPGAHPSSGVGSRDPGVSVGSGPQNIDTHGVFVPGAPVRPPAPRSRAGSARPEPLDVERLLLAEHVVDR